MIMMKKSTVVQALWGSLGSTLLLAAAKPTLGAAAAATNNNLRRHQQEEGIADILETVVYPDCFTDTSLLFDAMHEADPAVHTIYTICPDTVMKIGHLDDQKDCCVGGMKTLFAKTQTTIQCGEDGRSSNHCVLTGGDTHLFAIGRVYEDEYKVMENVHIKGLTFDAAEFVGAGLAAQGDIHFSDCIFQNFVDASSVIFQAYQPSRAPHDPEKDEESSNKEESKQVATNKSDDDGMKVTFANCVFDSNHQGPADKGGIPLYGVVSIMTRFNPTYFYGCTFRNNVFEGYGDVERGYAILSHGSPVYMEGTIMENNSFAGMPFQILPNIVVASEGTKQDA